MGMLESEHEHLMGDCPTCQKHIDTIARLTRERDEYIQPLLDAKARAEARAEQAEAERDRLKLDVVFLERVLALAARRFADGDREGVRRLLCDMNARENAAAALRGEEGE